MATTTPVNENTDRTIQEVIHSLIISKKKTRTYSSSTPRLPPRLRLPLLNLQSPENDTMIYVQSNSHSQPLRCSSQKLLATGSSVFERLLGPTYQFRILRRKNLLKLGLPLGIKFVVDLSPPIEGEEAVDAVERFWCPDEILEWNSNLDGNFIEDDQSPPDSPLFDVNLPLSLTVKMESDLEAFREDLLKKTKGETAQPEENLKVVTQVEKEETKKPAYSLLRHTGAIERVLYILHGLDPQISTTPMWYTVHKVALQMECTAAVQDHILSWLYQNQNFMEQHPGYVLQTAAEMKNAGLYRDAFAILVGKQLQGGKVEKAGVFNFDESIPPGAEPWGESIIAAKRSLQGRLERLYNYINSTAWLDNAKVIPEYNKITVNLKAKGPMLRRATSELDEAIRAVIKAQLATLFAFSEDPGDPNWMNPWEKAMFDMMPGPKQIFSRMYWKQLFNFPTDRIGTLQVSRALAHWNITLHTVETDLLIDEDTQGTNFGATNSEVETAICLLSLGREAEESVEADPERAETRVMSSMPNNPTRTRWQNFKRRSTQNTVSSSSRTPISGPTEGNGTTTGFSYPSASNSVPPGQNYPHELSTIDLLDGPPPYTLHAIDTDKVGEKRKMRLSDLDGSCTDMKEIESHRKETEFIDSSTIFPDIRPGRVEVENPMRKRRCSVERDPGEDEDENITEASFFRQGDTEAGEPEMFNISGVYSDPRLSSSPLPTPLGKGKEKAIEDEPENPPSEEYDLGDHETLNAADDEYQLHYFRAARSAPPLFDEPMTLDPTSDSSLGQFTSLEFSHWLPPSHENLPSDALTTNWVDPTRSIIARVVNDHNFQRSSHTTHTTGVTETAEEGRAPSYWRIPVSALTVPNTRHHLPDTCLLFSIEQLKKEIKAYLTKVSSTQLKIPISFEPFWAGDGLIVSLREEEWAFCPAWAGGLDISGAPADTVDNNNIRTEGRMVELEIRGGLSSGLPKRDQSEGDEKEEEYDDCATETGSIGSFSTSGFSSFGVISEGDGESDNGTVAGDDVQFDVETESLLGSDAEVGDQSATEAGDSSDSDDGFEEVVWDEGF
ncbi:uncharacterized protein H6S33_006638 [Morchella sextelata]|uniref:uncharacterized protein n=1 Tax=Morchella sextelata TaxID=1174677 RepID=UPI001D05A18C|nr:uncharacterized protein H6S33_006638 [Morchella sextelata]KAH0604261.1 hypothetical protein H6S33_006638 [Morchella sextelata]